MDAPAWVTILPAPAANGTDSNRIADPEGRARWEEELAAKRKELEAFGRAEDERGSD
jgi:hypothetical protein